ncbi:MAG: hypothetical protein II670_02135 [Alphaproteobacteria bacterium]|nr:hypothetical protein [Alphaproteobacteria bacterium]
MAKYIRKSFSAHIYQDWIHLFKQCSVEQRSELLLAITDYPNYEPTMDIAIWDFIKSQLDVQYQKTENKSQTMSDNRNKSRPKSTEVDQSQPMSTEVDKCSQIEIEIKKETEIKNKEKELSDDNSKKKPINFDTTFQAGGQGWKIPTEFRKLALTRWTETEIREFEKEHSCHENLIEVCLNDMPAPKPKTTKFVKPTIEEIKAYCEERKNNIDANNFFDNYEMKGWKINGSPMKDWKAAVRTWERRDYNRPQQPQKKNWSNYVGEGSFLKPDGEW